MTHQILRLDHIHKSYGIKTVLHDVSLLLNAGDRAALVGENGAGKTTLARIILGMESADDGKITLAEHAEIGYLPQEAGLDADLTVREYVEHATGRLDAIREQMAQLESVMQHDTSDEILTRYGDLQDEFMRRGGYELEHRLEAIFDGLGMNHLDMGRIVRSLSGGEKTRVALAALLLQAPDLLILDEPTNHLDFEAMTWLERYLMDIHGALLIISHDRAFINQTATQIIELSTHTHSVTIYHGDYEAYIAERERLFAKQVDQYEEQQFERKRLKSEINTRIYGDSKGKPATDKNKMAFDKRTNIVESKKSAQLRNVKKRLEVLEDNAITHPGYKWGVDFEFDPYPLESQEIIRLEGVEKRYQDRVILDQLSGLVRNSDHIAIVAPNGSGKSTLLKIIAGLMPPEAGHVRIAPNAQLYYLDQEQETLDADLRVVDAFAEHIDMTKQDIIGLLHKCGLYAGDHPAEKRIGDLSIGQKRKLQLAQLIAQRANVLLLDEPTNHLDLTALEALESALIAFDGTIIAATHDRWFIERFATTIWRLENGKLTVETP